MRHSTRLMAGLIAIGALAALATTGGARPQDPPGRALKFAVVNMGDCMEPAKNEQSRDLETRFNGLNREAQDEVTRIRKKADELRAQVKAVEETSRGSQLFFEKLQQYNLEEARYEIAKKMNTTQLLAARDLFQAQLYSEVRKMVTVVAQELKIDIVLRGDEGAIDEDKSDLSIQKNRFRAVLYHDPALDITGKVLARLNEEYRKKKPVSYLCPKCKVESKEPKCPKCGEALKN